MLLRRAILAALVVAPFVYSPSEASAQTGRDRAAVATANAEAVGAAQNSQAPEALPPGIAKQSGQTLPPGIRWTRGEPAAPPTDDGTTGGDDLVCLAWETVVSGFTVTQECILWGTP